MKTREPAAKRIDSRIAIRELLTSNTDSEANRYSSATLPLSRMSREEEPTSRNTRRARPSSRGSSVPIRKTRGIEPKTRTCCGLAGRDRDARKTLSTDGGWGRRERRQPEIDLAQLPFPGGPLALTTSNSTVNCGRCGA